MFYMPRSSSTPGTPQQAPAPNFIETTPNTDLMFWTHIESRPRYRDDVSFLQHMGISDVTVESSSSLCTCSLSLSPLVLTLLPRLLPQLQLRVGERSRTPPLQLQHGCLQGSLLGQLLRHQLLLLSLGLKQRPLLLQLAHGLLVLLGLPLVLQGLLQPAVHVLQLVDALQLPAPQPGFAVRRRQPQPQQLDACFNSYSDMERDGDSTTFMN
ncbi:hypothetical protein EYF80_003073 [Liparis tanakae]|uniref:Uncharacterized protein n=1 Tax=Liparis tanakae TaxID=230148 RepID=A0A4Z2J8B6_9TELE|nr:hypothetical protein EYF80_003073 [Liparis tanakae]